MTERGGGGGESAKCGRGFRRTYIKGANSMHTCNPSLLLLLLMSLMLLLLLSLLQLLLIVGMLSQSSLQVVHPRDCGCRFFRGDGTFIVDNDCIIEVVTPVVVVFVWWVS